MKENFEILQKIIKQAVTYLPPVLFIDTHLFQVVKQYR